MSSILRGQRLVTTAAVCQRGDRFFLARRKPGGSEALKWEFPGGKCDNDTDEDRCLVREFAEEFGVEITVHDALGSVPFSHKGTDYILVGYRVDIPEHANLELREHMEYGWFTLEQMRALDLAGSDRTLMESFLGTSA